MHLSAYLAASVNGALRKLALALNDCQGQGRCVSHLSWEFDGKIEQSESGSSNQFLLLLLFLLEYLESKKLM